jgi:rhodanese-related sulfurtransferase
LLDFFLRHWELSSAFALALLALLLLEGVKRFRSVARIEVLEAVQSMNHGQALILDLRPLASYQAGHILGAYSVPDLELATANEWRRQLNKSVILVTNSEAQLSPSSQKIQSLGFKKIFQLKGGMNAWLAASMPVVKS